MMGDAICSSPRPIQTHNTDQGMYHFKTETDFQNTLHILSLYMYIYMYMCVHCMCMFV